jgi:hypothetical protein
MRKTTQNHETRRPVSRPRFELSTNLSGSFVTTAWRDFGLQMEERPPDKEGSFEYIQKAVADSRRGMVLQLGVLGMGVTTLRLKKAIMKRYTENRT